MTSVAVVVVLVNAVHEEFVLRLGQDWLRDML
jgi:hypothetical protein